MMTVSELSIYRKIKMESLGLFCYYVGLCTHFTCFLAKNRKSAATASQSKTV